MNLKRWFGGGSVGREGETRVRGDSYRRELKV
jgi:hypothetical protein